MKKLKPINVNINLHTLTRHKKVESWGKAEPYLWTIFFKIDGETLIIAPNFRLEGEGTFHFALGSHGNLGLSNLNQESTVKIPKAIGEWNTTLYPFVVPYFQQEVPSIVGVISVLMEQNNVSYKGAEAGHQALNKLVQDSVNKSLKAFEPKLVDINDVMGSIKSFFEEKIAEYTDGAEDIIVNAIKGEQNLLLNLWSLIKADNLIGYKVWNFNQKEIADKTKEGIDFSERWISNKHGDWEIFGKITVLDKPPVTAMPKASTKQEAKKVSMDLPQPDVRTTDISRPAPHSKEE